MEWKPIETAPKDGTEILITDGRDMIVACWTKNGRSFRDESFGEKADGWSAPLDGYVGGLDDATHWMPLPDLPEKS